MINNHTLQRQSIDRTTLPAAMLNDVKAQMRVEHNRDDALITKHIARAIDYVERYCDICIFEAQYMLRIQHSVSETTNLLPVAPIIGINVKTGTTDVTTNYTLTGYTTTGEIGGQYIEGKLNVNQVINIQAGYKTVADMPPVLDDVISRHAAHLYEQRESLMASNIRPSADVMHILNSLMWRPRI